MARLLSIVFVVLVGCIPAPIMNRFGSAPVAGTYVANGGSITLQQTGPRVTGTVQLGATAATLEGEAVGAQVRGTVTLPGQPPASFSAYVTQQGLQISLANGQSYFLARSTGLAQPTDTTMANATPMPNAPMPNALDAPNLSAPQPIAQPAPGTGTGARGPYRDEVEGWEVKTPDGWSHGVKNGQLMFGGDTEHGLILVTFYPGVTFDQMVAAVGGQIAQLGATQSGPTRTVQLAGGRALVVEMTGRGADGVEFAGRGVGVSSPAGVVSVFGVVTKDRFESVRKRVDQIAGSARFFTPTVSPAVKYLAGPWWHFHSTGKGGNSSSYERTIELCANGTFFDSDQSQISVTTRNPIRPNDPYSDANRIREGAGAGRWTATGNDVTGTLRLVHKNGNVEQRVYTFKKRGGGDIYLDRQWFGYSKEKGGRCR